MTSTASRPQFLKRTSSHSTVRCVQLGGVVEMYHTYGGGMSIQAILNQFLNHRDQAVADNLAGLDLVDLCIGSVWTRCICERGEGGGGGIQISAQ